MSRIGAKGGTVSAVSSRVTVLPSCAYDTSGITQPRSLLYRELLEALAKRDLRTRETENKGYHLKICGLEK